ncbi:MAG: adenosylcobinamide-GDP ribazoletransferase [Negativicutes bacterium]|jgi:adenosylcobinamide-GDP ribazoletransferase
MMNAMKFAFSILTTVPFGFSCKFDDKTWPNSVYFYPLCGYLLALLSAGSFFAFAKIIYIPDLIQAVGIATFLFLLTGGMHLDGLADTCDSLFCPASRDKRIEIMHDSRIGAFGTIGLFFILATKISALYILVGTHKYLEIFCAIVIARFMLVVLIKIGRYFPYEIGMGQEIIGKIPWLTLLVAFIYSAPCIFAGWNTAITTLILLGVVLFLNYRANAKLDGISGDILGTAVEICETFGFILLTLNFH